MFLIKTKITDNNNNHFLHPILNRFIKHNHFKGDIALDYRNRVRIHNSLIPFLLNKKIIFKYLDTFQQNNSYLSNKIRKYVFLNIDNSIMCIGGESYIYGIESKNFIYYSNCKKLCFESDYNSNSKSIYIKDYNKLDKKQFKIIYPIVIINLSKLNKELLLLLNSFEIHKIIIINCHHKDFWKKIKYLDKFKLINREKFIGKEYFITVNIFNRK
jgi:hypothetical protein